MKRIDHNGLERELTAALPPKNAPEEFKMELKSRLMHSIPARRRRLRPGFGLMGIAAALLLTLGYLAWPMLFPANLPLLPSLALTGRETLGASGGPGFTVVLNYQLSGALAALPKQAPVYRYTFIPFSAQTVEQLAKNLGINGKAEQQAWQDSYTWSVGEPNVMIYAFPDGFINYYKQPPTHWNREFGSDAELIATAKAFLPKIGIAPESVKLLKVSTGDNETPAGVMFVPAEITNQVSISPYVNVSVGADNQVYGVGWVWPSNLQPTHFYQTRSVERAWADVQAGMGKLFIEYANLIGPASGDQLQGNAVISSASVGYVLTYDQNGDVVMQPVAAFNGLATFADGKPVPFTVYTSLIDEKYYAK